MLKGCIKPYYSNHFLRNPSIHLYVFQTGLIPYEVMGLLEPIPATIKGRGTPSPVHHSAFFDASIEKLTQKKIS